MSGQHSAWKQLEDALGFCSPKKQTNLQIQSRENTLSDREQEINFVQQFEPFSGAVVRSQNDKLISAIRRSDIAGKSNSEREGIWTVQGLLHDETVDAYPTLPTSDLLVRDCAGDKGWTTIISHGTCRKLAVVNSSQVRILCDHAMEEGLLTRCNTVELILGGHPPKLVIDKCRTVRLIMYRPQNTTPELECHDSVQIIYQSAVIANGDRAAAEDVMQAPKFDPVVVRGNTKPDSPLGTVEGLTGKESKSTTTRTSGDPAKSQAGAFSSADVGIELIVTTETYFKISRVIPYGGAYMSGQIKSGDALHSVDGVPVYGKTVEEVQERLTGEAGTSVLMALQTVGPTGLQGMWRTVLVERVQLDLSQRSRQAHLDIGFGLTIVVNHNQEGEIVMVQPGSAAEATGRIAIGDVITEVESESTPYAEDVVRAMTAQSKAKTSMKLRKVSGQMTAVALSKEVSQVTDLLGRQWCSIKHSYLPRQVDELELQAGESIFVLEGAEDDGWYIAEKQGKRGLVPATHVVFHGHDVAPASTVRMAQATHTYKAVNSDELSFQKGDVLPIMSEAADPGWFLSRLDGKDGLVPSTHLIFLTTSLPAVPTSRAPPPKQEMNWSTAAAGSEVPASCWSCGAACDGGVVFCPKCKAPISLAEKVRRP